MAPTTSSHAEIARDDQHEPVLCDSHSRHSNINSLRRVAMGIKKGKTETKKQDDIIFMADLEDRLKQESKPQSLDNGPLIKAVEDWMTARGFDPVDKRVHLHFSFLDRGECQIGFSMS